MNWKDEIRKNPELNMEASDFYVSPEERREAGGKYRKAVDNALGHSVDMAIIELRKLAVLFPQQGQISVVLGFCQAMAGEYDSAVTNFKKSADKELPASLRENLDDYILAAEDAKIGLTDKFATTAGKSRQFKPEIVAAKPGRWKERKVANRREKKEIARELNIPGGQRYFVTDNSRPGSGGKILLTGLVILLLGALAFGFIQLYPFIREAFRDRAEKTENQAWLMSRLEEAQKDSQKLDWLLEELRASGMDDKTIEQILYNYDLKFKDEDKDLSSDPHGQDTSSDDTLSSGIDDNSKVGPSDPDEKDKGDYIFLAYEKILLAEEIGKDNPAEVMKLIVEVRDKLEGIDENVTSGDLPMNVGEIMAEGYRLEKGVVNPACYKFYSEGKAFFGAKNYKAAQESFKKVFDINPDYMEGSSTYNLGKAFEADKQYRESNKYFQYVVDNFPGTDYEGWAAYRIRDLDDEGEESR